MRFHSAARCTILLTAALVAASGSAYADDRQVCGFIGGTFGGETTFLNVDQTVGKKTKLIVGGSAVFLGEIFGAEIEVADVPGFFEAEDSPLVIDSRVTTFSGNVVIAAPRRWTEYWLRPYVVGGGGLMRVRTTTSLNIFDVSTFLASFDVGGGVVGFLTNRAGVAWEVRRFQSLGGDKNNGGQSFGPEDLSFWRATMSVAIRY
jgi:hypothetical protein